MSPLQQCAAPADHGNDDLNPVPSQICENTKLSLPGQSCPDSILRLRGIKLGRRRRQLLQEALANDLVDISASATTRPQAWALRSAAHGLAALGLVVIRNRVQLACEARLAGERFSCARTGMRPGVASLALRATPLGLAVARFLEREVGQPQIRWDRFFASTAASRLRRQLCESPQPMTSPTRP
jgi:hypothetical protein